MLNGTFGSAGLVVWTEGAAKRPLLRWQFMGEAILS